MKRKLIEFYLDWVNNFLTIGAMAEYYGLSEDECNSLIELGRKYHEENVLQLHGSTPIRTIIE